MSLGSQKSLPRRSTLALPLVLLALLTAGAQAQVLDDFEEGPFSLSDASFASGLQTGLTAGHCIATERFTQLFVNGVLSGADLNLVSPDDEVTTVWGDGGGHLQFSYDFPTADLTHAGQYDAVRVRFTVAVAAGRVEVLLRDGGGVSQLANQGIVGPGDYVIPFSDFPGVDLGDVVHAELHLDVPGVGDYHISDFRVWRTGTKAGAMDVTQGDVAGPPYPTQAATIVLSGQDAAGSPLALEQLSVSLQNVTDGGGMSIASELILMDSGGPVGMPGEQVVMMGSADPTSSTKRAAFIKLDWTQFQYQGLGGFESVMGINPCVHVHPPEPGASDPTAFTVHFTNYLRDRLGNSLYRGVHTLVYECVPGSGFFFSGVQARMGVDPQPFYQLSFDVFTNGAAALATKVGTPVYAVQLNSAYYDFAEQTAVEPWGPRGTVALWAQPNVMGSDTQLWRSQGLEQTLELRLFDAAGRAVRTLTIPASASFTTWDGRDAKGTDVASGIYFLRAMNAPAVPAAKIVKVK